MQINIIFLLKLKNTHDKPITHVLGGILNQSKNVETVLCSNVALPLNSYIKGFSDQFYHSLEYMSSHGLMNCMKSYAHCVQKKNNPIKQTDAMRFGTAAHVAMLEPEKFSKIVLQRPITDRRTTKGKEDYANFEASLGPDNVAVSQDEFHDIKQMQMVLQSHKEWQRHFSQQTFVESFGLVRPLANQEIYRFKPDMVTDEYIVEYKTTDDASEASFMRDAANFKYHMQGAFYLHCDYLISGKTKKYIIFAQEKEAPFAVNVFEPSDEWLQRGWERLEQAFEKYYSGKEQETFDVIRCGYGEKTKTLELPLWELSSFAS